MSAAVALQSALSLIDLPGRWTKNAMALDAAGNEVDQKSDKAVCFCMVGALQRVPCSSTDYGIAIRHLRLACNGSIFEFNDSHGHKAVKSAMRRAIAAAEAA
jgi:hypothetical protein